MERTLSPEYTTAQDFLYSFIDYERDSKWIYDRQHFDLDRMHNLLVALGNPHEHGWCVHIAGTNGKGSVAAMISNALVAAGLRTGLYTSPHLVSFRERIRVNGSMITSEEIVEGVKRIKPAAQSIPDLTFFEVWTGLAFDHFARVPVDASVIEVGIGGRLDSTNVITPAVSVITSISIDHLGKLGETLTDIAFEKAGIIKHRIPVVSAPQEQPVLRLLEERAKDKSAQFILLGRDVHINTGRDRIDYNGRLWRLGNVYVPLNGFIQCQNAGVALAALETLACNKYPVDSSAARIGIETVQWPGRFQTISTHPEIIVDGACNTGAMFQVTEFLSSRCSRNKTVAVIAMCRDKEVAKVLDILRNAASTFVCTQTINPRAAKAEELAQLSPGTVTVIIEPDPARAVGKATDIAGKEGTVIVTGSLYLVGEIMKLYGKESIEQI
ncbi:MAG TPA: folylpolyglutamate synthase/dihydrofolate synthase family protein [Anaerolineae bacterium]|nr:folylpolyglutamate synthase/dihydrofolate synthase family protein [Anaerolineae bacterium]